jgi:sporulation protein YlmC with PRC-barrel domain
MKRKLIASTMAFSLGATLAFAQADQSSPTNSQSAQGGQGAQSQQQQGKEASQQELKVSPEQMQQHVTDINKASKLIGMQVRNTKNELLGKINDLVVDQKSGKIAYAAMSIGGVLGVGDKLVAVPFEALTPNSGQNGLVLNIEKQRLQQAPGFSQNNWPDLDAASKGQTVGIATSTQTQGTGATGSQSQEQSGQSQSATNSSTQSDPSKQQPAQPPTQDQSGSDPEKKAGASGTDKEPTPPDSIPQ